MYRPQRHSHPKHSHHSHRYAPLSRSSDEAHPSSSVGGLGIRRSAAEMAAAGAGGAGAGGGREPASGLLREIQQQDEEGTERAKRHATSNSLWGRCTRFFSSLHSPPRFCERTVFLGCAGIAASCPDGPPFPDLPPLGAASPSSLGASGAVCDPPLSSFPPNVVRNQKYHLITFLPHFLFEQFRFFFNFYFLIVALSQFIPVLQIGFLFTYVAPLLFVLSVTMAKEGLDDLQRWRRDREANGQRYQRLRKRTRRDTPSASSSVTSGDTSDSVLEDIPSSSIRVGDILVLHSNQRVPADMLLLRTHDRSLGSIFIRTDQLDGETDWKLRNAVRATQGVEREGGLLDIQAKVEVEAPRKEIYEFAANFTVLPPSSSSLSNRPDVVIDPSSPSDSSFSMDDPAHASLSLSLASASSASSGPLRESLSLDHTLWANTVVASGTVAGLVIYTGGETRAAMNANKPRSKVGALEEELNAISKLLFGLTVSLAFVMVALKGLHGAWLLYLFRFILLFSSIIPISMRVNLDLSKTLYARLVETDERIPGTLVRNSTIPEELGRIRYVFMDKTGTLTRNIMHFKCLQLQPPLFFTKATLGKLAATLRAAFVAEREERRGQQSGGGAGGMVGPILGGGSVGGDGEAVHVSLAPMPLEVSTPSASSSSSSSAFDRALSDDVDAPPSPSRSGRSRGGGAAAAVRKGVNSRPTSPGSLLLDVSLDVTSPSHSSAAAHTAAAAAASSAPAPGATTKLARMATRLQLEAEEAEEDESAALAVGIVPPSSSGGGGGGGGGFGTGTGSLGLLKGAEDESESDAATEHRSFISGSQSGPLSASSTSQRLKLAASLAHKSLARARKKQKQHQQRQKGGYSNLDSSRGHAHDDDDDEEDDEEEAGAGVEMGRMGTAATSAATNATGRRRGSGSGSGALLRATSFDEEDEEAEPSRHRLSGHVDGSHFVVSPSPSLSSPDDYDASSTNVGATSVSSSSAGAAAAAASGGVDPESDASSARVQGMVRALITALALCHNVTPVRDEDTGAVEYQASSPDEVALVKFTASVGLTLKERTQKHIVLQTPLAAFDAAQGIAVSPAAASASSSTPPTSDPSLHTETYHILHLFPFTSESRRMGIIVRSAQTGGVTFLLKGAESVMASKISRSDWLEEEVDNLARVGLRTLVIAQKIFSSEGEYQEFARRLAHAQSMLQDRELAIQNFLHTVEKNMTLLGLTGVEDKLQEAVKPTLETMRNAGMSLWMLTGDKAETATCIGISARLIDRNQPIFQFLSCTSQRETAEKLDAFSSKLNTCLVIDGPSLEICLQSFQKLFLELACACPAVICARCSPTQKAQVVALMKSHTGVRTCAIGDGGNDVSMILAADVGVGIVGKEGMQASLAADFSIVQFSHLLPLLLWHGRNAYKRSARLSQFVMHRGLMISIIQAVFSALFFFAAIPIYNGWLMVGYATFYTMLPVFSLVLDEDVDQEKVYLYPELYRELQKGRPLSSKTFFIWMFQSVYQGGIIMLGVLLLFESKFLNIVSITFTALIASELLNVALEIHRWHRLMVAAEATSIVVYVASLFLLPEYFDISFIFTWGFVWKVCLITTVSCLPPALAKYLHSKYNPSAQSKVNQS